MKDTLSLMSSDLLILKCISSAEISSLKFAVSLYVPIRKFVTACRSELRLCFEQWDELLGVVSLRVIVGSFERIIRDILVENLENHLKQSEWITLLYVEPVTEGSRPFFGKCQGQGKVHISDKVFKSTE